MTNLTNSREALDSRAGARRIAIADDEPFVHDAIRGLLDGTGWRHEEHHYHNVEDVVRAAKARELPSVLLLDVYFPTAGDASGSLRRERERTFAAIAAIRHHQREVQVVVMTARSVAPEHVFDALRAGAVGYVTKSDLHRRLCEILDEVCAGGSPITPGIARQVVDFVGQRPASEAPSVRSHAKLSGARFTDGEVRLLDLVGKGQPLAECARALNVSDTEARGFVRNIYVKLEALSRADFVAAATRDAFIPRARVAAGGVSRGL
jgi:DNA-binding NarL/FixJ family response regulator